MRDFFKSLRDLVGLQARADPLRFVGILLVGPVSGMVPTIYPLVLKFGVDAISKHDARTSLLVAFLFGGLATATFIASWGSATLSFSIGERTGHYVEKHLMELVTAIPGISHYERPSFLNQIFLMRWEAGALSQLPQSLVGNLTTLVRAVFTLGLLASIHPLLLLVPVAGVPTIWARTFTDRLSRRTSEGLAEDERLVDAYFQLACQAQYGKEIRLFGLRSELRGRYMELRERVDRVRRISALKCSIIGAGADLVFAAAYVGSILFVAQRAALGQASPGTVAMALTLVGMLSWQVSAVANVVVTFKTVVRGVKRHVWLRSQAVPAVGSGREVDVPVAIADGLDLKQVSFTYPDTDAPVLEGVNLRFPAGTTVAIVGENGAGKSTLVKLLARLYEPTEGTIEVDGTDIRDFSVEAWRGGISGAFQDFLQLDLTVREAVGIGNHPQIRDSEAVMDALGRARAASIVEELPAGLDTQLGKTFEDGTDLSGGQWQKLALGRAMMRVSPLLLLLDEPTASLDAEAEDRLFQRFADRAEGFEGGITILVSHRFSTVRQADLILVLEGGRITQAGTHSELMKNGGLYSELFETQARAYR